MADAKKAEVEVAVTPPKKKVKWLLFVVIGIVGLALGGGGTFLLVRKPPQPASMENADAAAREVPTKKKVDPSAPPVFYKFDKAFTVKLQTEQQEAYLQTEVQLKLLDATGLELMKQFEPELKHRITLSLMNSKASSLASAAGVQRLANELRDLTNKVISPPAEADKNPATTEPAETAAPGAPVQSVLFSTFIIQ